jgi:hypothetical protein
MKTLSAIVVSTLFATLTVGCADSASSSDGLETTRFALAEGSPEAIGLLEFLNTPTTSVDVLDKQVPLNRRTARNLVHHRDGFDGTAGTYDDNLFDTLAEVDAVRWVGPAAMDSLVTFALNQNWVPSGDDTLGNWDGVTFTVAEAAATLAFANEASLDLLDYDLGLDRRAAMAIVSGQPIASIEALAGLYYVGKSALDILKAAAEDAAPSLDETFTEDLSRHLGEWYETYGADVAAAGGNDLLSAQEAISADLVELVTDTEDDPFGYDLTTTDLLAHPDVAFPGSDAVWFGAYDKATGELLEVARFE